MHLICCMTASSCGPHIGMGSLRPLFPARFYQTPLFEAFSRLCVALLPPLRMATILCLLVRFAEPMRRLSETLPMSLSMQRWCQAADQLCFKILGFAQQAMGCALCALSKASLQAWRPCDSRRMAESLSAAQHSRLDAIYCVLKPDEKVTLTKRRRRFS